MLFNSLEFIFIFLPVVLGVFYAIGASGHAASAQIFLTLASFAFYSYWNPIFLPFLIGSIAFNFFLSRTILQSGTRTERQIKFLMGARIAVNLFFLGFFKYTNFIYTFTEIAYLIDVYKRRTEPATFKNYSFFVVFFLISLQVS